MASIDEQPSAKDAKPSAAPTPTPAPTAYPAPKETPPAPADTVTSYPDYGGGVDCENGTFNDRPYAGNLKSIDAPDPMTVVFTFCKPGRGVPVADRLQRAGHQ